MNVELILRVKFSDKNVQQKFCDKKLNWVGMEAVLLMQLLWQFKPFYSNNPKQLEAILKLVVTSLVLYFIKRLHSMNVALNILVDLLNAFNTL